MKRLSLFFTIALFSFNCFSGESFSISESIYFTGENSTALKMEVNDSITVEGLYLTAGKEKKIIGKMENNIITFGDGNEDISTIKITRKGALLEGVWHKDNKPKKNLISNELRYSDLIKNITLAKESDDKYVISLVFENNTEQQLPFLSLDEDNVTLYFEDLDFDGYPDLRVVDNISSANVSYVFWLYDKERRLFTNGGWPISYISNIDVDKKEKIVKGLTRNSAYSYQVTMIMLDLVKIASFDYHLNTGEEVILDKSKKILESSKISKERFERIYMKE